MLSLVDYSVSITNQEILKEINQDFELGKIYWLKGVNGSGKSTLFKSLIGYDNLQSGGQIILSSDDGSVDLKPLSMQKRFGMGLFMIFQDPPELQGVSIVQFLKAIIKPAEQGSKYSSIKEFLTDLKKHQKTLGLEDNFYTKDVHYGLSGGQKKRLEILQMLMLEPKYVLIDEIDSGLDPQGREIIAEILNSYKAIDRLIIVCSHLSEFTSLLQIDVTLEIRNKQIVSV